MQTSCGLPLQLSLPQDTKHLAQAVYDDTTPCREFLFRTLQPWSYGSALRLEFVDFDSPRAWGLTYHSCTDTTWEATVDFTSGSTTVGPVPTYTVVYNPCDTPQMFELNMTVTEGTTVLPNPNPYLPVSSIMPTSCTCILSTQLAALHCKTKQSICFLYCSRSKPPYSVPSTIQHTASVCLIMPMHC